MRQKTIRFGGIKIRLLESQKFLTIQFNFCLNGATKREKE